MTLLKCLISMFRGLILFINEYPTLYWHDHLNCLNIYFCVSMRIYLKTWHKLVFGNHTNRSHQGQYLWMLNVPTVQLKTNRFITIMKVCSHIALFPFFLTIKRVQIHNAYKMVMSNSYKSTFVEERKTPNIQLCQTINFARLKEANGHYIHP